MFLIFLDGPFKGSIIETNAPDLKELNSKPDYEVSFIKGPLEGLKTCSLVCYDRAFGLVSLVSNYSIPNGEFKIHRKYEILWHK